MTEMERDVRRSPYRGILPFRYADRAYFFGREREITELSSKILLYRLVVLFGDSGSGKSSLVNAGVVPKLEQEGFRPERLRIRPFVESPFVIERIASGRPDSLFLPTLFIECASDETAESREISCSFQSFERAVARATPEAPLVLIFDQFEELFTLFDASMSELQARILQTISEVANRKDLPIKILIGIREDFLGKLEMIAKEYPQVFDRRVRLGMLSSEAAKRAVVGPFEKKGEFSSEIAAETGEAIIGELAEGTEYPGVHPTQLQIICSRLWDQYFEKVPTIVKEQFLSMGGVKGILEGFLESVTVAPSFGQPQDMAFRVLGQLITASGTRDVVSYARLKAWWTQEVRQDEQALTIILNFLEEKRLINRTLQHSMYYFEVSSEYILAPIKRFNRERECMEAERKAAEAAVAEAKEAARARELEQARLLASEQARLAELEGKRAEFEAHSVRRLKRRSRILVVLSAFLIFAMIGVYLENKRASYEAEKANMEAARANKEAALATHRAVELEKAKIVAEENLKEAMAANMRLTEKVSNSAQQAKRPFNLVNEDMKTKADAFSRDPERFRDALTRHPSRIRFDVNLKELGIDQKVGKMYRFDLFPVLNTVEGGHDSLAMITMLMDDPSFRKSIIAAGPERGFVCSYEGWGCLDNVVAVIEFKNPDRRAEVAVVRMCDIIANKFGSMQKR